MPDHQFNATSVWVRDPQPGQWDPARVVGGAAVGGYVPLVLQHLANIAATGTGLAFFPALTAFGKRQIVRYEGENVPNENSAFGPQASANKLIRQHFGSGNYIGTGAELNLALMSARGANPAHDAAWLATQLLTTPLHRWDPATTSATSPLKPAGVGLGTPAFNNLVAALVQTIGRWANGSLHLTDKTTMDLVVLILEPHLRNGTGGATRIHYNPLKTIVGGVHRAPECGLFHELVHAYYNAAGSQLSEECSTNEDIGRYFELMAVGLPPFAGRPYHENAMRQWFANLARTQY